jgi:hypothetical protein
MTRSEAGKLGYEKSREAQESAKLNRVEGYNKNKTLCKFCSSALEYENRNKSFCNHSCSASFNNKAREKTQVFCINCNITITGADRNKRVYCSNKCQQSIIKEKNFKDLVEGKSIKLSDRSIRLLLIEKFGARCMGGPTEDTKDCRWDKINPTTGNCPIELEHIDGNSENNVLSNLKLLCPSCHSLTPTYKALNKGKVRHKRRERYKEGKSF